MSGYEGPGGGGDRSEPRTEPGSAGGEAEHLAVDPPVGRPTSDAEGEQPSRTSVVGAVEAVLLVADEPVSTAALAQAVAAPVPVVETALRELVAFYDTTGRGFELRELAGGWRYYTRAEHADVVAAFVLEGQQARLSQAALETLAVIAYLQPVGRGRISAVRGVNVDAVLKTLLGRGLVAEAGRDPESGAVLFQTTGTFLEKLGLRSLEELPPLAPYLPEVADLEAELSQLTRVEEGGPGE
jgi:segregation and condensation protein B